MKLPVVVLLTDARITGREGVELRRAAQTKALGAAAARAGISCAGFSRDADGAPLPREDGWCWSVANTGAGVVASVARGALGVDLESLDRERVADVGEFCDPEERARLAEWDTAATLRLWTAKEAVLKKAGCGISELRACRLAAAPEADTMLLSHRETEHRVRHLRPGRLIVAFTCDAAGEPELLVLEAPA
jgi:hypothetical protein